MSRTWCPPSLLLLAGCVAAEVTPAPRPAPAPSAAPTSPTPTAIAAPAVVDPTPAKPSAAPLAEPLPPLTRAFADAPLSGVPVIISVAPRGPRDVWMLTDGGDVLQHDGARVVKVHKRPCLPTDPNGWGAVHARVIALGHEILVYGTGPGNRGSTAEYIATFERGRWSCNSYGWPATMQAVAADVIWGLYCNPYDGRCWFEQRGGPPIAPLLRVDDSRDAQTFNLPHLTGVWMRAPDDAWLAVDDDRPLWRYRGVAWRPVALPEPADVVDVLPEENGHAWLAVRVPARPSGGEEQAVANRLWRWDGHELRRVPVPESFRVRRMVAADAQEVWFIGEGHRLYQWDGQRLRQGEAPFDAQDARASPGGGVWIAGASGDKGRAAWLAPQRGTR